MRDQKLDIDTFPTAALHIIRQPISAGYSMMQTGGASTNNGLPLQPANAATSLASLPRAFYCPLTNAVMRDPVIDLEGNRCASRPPRIRLCRTSLLLVQQHAALAEC